MKGVPYEASDGCMSGADVGAGDWPGKEYMSDPRERGGKDVILRTDQLEKPSEKTVCAHNNNNTGACRFRRHPGSAN